MLSEKVEMITPSHTVGINTKVNELKAMGKDVINLSIGEPDFFTPEIVKHAAKEAINKNKVKYDKVQGLTELRMAISEKLSLENNVQYEPDEIVVSNGAKQAISNTLFAMLNSGDEVLVPKPYWVSYPEMIKIAGGVPVFLETDKSSDYKVLANDILKSITPKTKLIFITNPSNPSGVLYTKEELQSIVKVCIENNIYIIADEIYERICFENEFVSIASLSDKAKDMTITINGLSKSIPMTGWRIGYSASNKKIAKAITKLQGHLTSHPCTISQWAGVTALKESAESLKGMVYSYQVKRDVTVQELKNMKDISFIDPKGAFYVFIDVSKYKEKVAFEDSFSIEFCNMLLEKANVAAVPGIAFGLDDFIRISYACDTKLLLDGLRRINKFLNDL